MPTLAVLLAVVTTLLAVALGIALRRTSAAWLRFRGQRVVVCPENQRGAGVRVDAVHAAFTAWTGSPQLRLSGCSRWPARGSCGQECVRQIEAAPRDCLVRRILAQWYEGKTCARCSAPIGEVYWAGTQPVLLVSDGAMKQWNQIPPEELRAALDTARPVCFHCYLMECASPRQAKTAVS